MTSLCRTTQLNFWREEDDDLLVSLWSKLPCLFDIRCANKKKKERALIEISERVGKTVGDVQKHITSLRTQFSRLLVDLPSGPAPPNFSKLTERQQWIVNHLTFLTPHIKKRSCVSVDPTKDDEESEHGEDREITDGIKPHRTNYLNTNTSGYGDTEFYPYDEQNGEITEKDNESLLIELWMAHPCLYDTYCAEFTDRNLREAAIREISDATQLTVPEVHKTLASLRTQFTRIGKSPLNYRTKRQQWITQKLNFLIPHIKRRRVTPEIKVKVENDESGEDRDTIPQHIFSSEKMSPQPKAASTNISSFSPIHESESCDEEFEMPATSGRSLKRTTRQSSALFRHRVGHSLMEEGDSYDEAGEGDEEIPSSARPAKYMRKPAKASNSTSGYSPADSDVPHPLMVVERYKEPEDDASVFSKYIANELRQIDDQATYLTLKNTIVNECFKAKMALLATNIPPAPPTSTTTENQVPLL